MPNPRPVSTAGGVRRLAFPEMWIEFEAEAHVTKLIVKASQVMPLLRCSFLDFASTVVAVSACPEVLIACSPRFFDNGIVRREHNPWFLDVRIDMGSRLYHIRIVKGPDLDSP